MIAFGPISSRRLGKSLGINNIASHKFCSYSCVYCQIGITRNKTLTRESYYEPEKLVTAVGNHLSKLDSEHIPDYLTFVSNGEPTLDINLGKEIRQLKKIGIPIALITNSSLMDHAEVRDEIMETDWISVKVDSVDEKYWRDINQPHEEIYLEKILEGLKSFAADYKGKLHTETMLVDGFNDSSKLLEQNASFIAGLKPECAYLSIPTRPPAVKGSKPAKENKLTEAWQIYEKAGLRTELLTGFEGTDTGYTGNAYDDIINITAVHPLREDTMSVLLEKDKADRSVVQSLISQGLIKALKHEGKTYFVRSYNFLFITK